MLSPYDELYDSYSGKRKRGAYPPQSPRPRRRWRCCCCLVVILLPMIVLGAVVGIVALTTAEDGKITGEAHLVSTVLPPSATPSLTPTPRASSTATPTAGAVLATAPLAASPSHPRPSPTVIHTTAAPVQGSPSDRFQFFAQSSGFPQSLDVEDTRCTPQETSFRLVFDHSLESNIAYLEVTLTADGTEAALADVQPILPAQLTVSEDVFVALNDTESFTLKGAQNTDEVLSKFTSAQERLHPRSLTAFSITWFNTNRQPSLAFEVRGTHPNAGGVLMTVRWARQPDERIDDKGVTFLVCE